MGDLIQLIFAVLGILVGLIFGRRAERKHFESLREREARLLHIPVFAESTLPPNGEEVKLVMGNVVIANDRFKAFIGSLQNFLGGRLTVFESLLDRARREAIIRVKEEASAWGATKIIHMRIETATVDKQGVEAFATATAVR